MVTGKGRWFRGKAISVPRNTCTPVSYSDPRSSLFPGTLLFRSLSNSQSNQSHCYTYKKGVQQGLNVGPPAHEDITLSTTPEELDKILVKI